MKTVLMGLLVVGMFSMVMNCGKEAGTAISGGLDENTAINDPPETVLDLCGNGVVDPGESCDIAIPEGGCGACPTVCLPIGPCTTVEVGNVGTCLAECHGEPIEPCDPSGWVPTIPSGDLLAKIPTCEPAAVAGVDIEPLDQVCLGTPVKLTAAVVNNHQVTCSWQLTSKPQNSSSELTVDTGSCVANITPDLTGEYNIELYGIDELGREDRINTIIVGSQTICDHCGNGVVDPEESCDIAIPEGQDGACPTSCPNIFPCSTVALWYAGTCLAICHGEPINPC